MAVKVKSNQPSTAIEGKSYTSTREPLVVDHLPIRRFTLEEYERLVDMGFFQEDERLELIDGILTPMMPINPPHARCLTLLLNQFYSKLGLQYEIRTQSPLRLTIDQSQLEPDVVLAKPFQGYNKRHPDADQVLLVIEISDSTLEADRKTKGEKYARSAIQEYWIMNLVDYVLEVYREPRVLTNGVATYQNRQIYLLDQQIKPLAFPACVIPIHEIFPEIEE